MAYFTVLQVRTELFPLFIPIRHIYKLEWNCRHFTVKMFNCRYLVVNKYLVFAHVNIDFNCSYPPGLYKWQVRVLTEWEFNWWSSIQQTINSLSPDRCYWNVHFRCIIQKKKKNRALSLCLSGTRPESRDNLYNRVILCDSSHFGEVCTWTEINLLFLLK